MKKLQFSAAIFMLALASCSKTEEINLPVIESEPFTIYATSEGTSTRTALSGDNYTDVVWQSGDAMNFYPVVLTDDVITSKMPGDATLQQGTELTTTDSGSSANFTSSDATLDLTLATMSDGTTSTATNYLALTPYLDNGGTAAANIKLNNADGGVRGTIYFRMPNSQVYVENSYDPSVAFAFAKSESKDNLTFYNQFGVLRINITGAETQTIKSIKVTANDDATGTARYLAGYINGCTKEDIDNGKTLSVSGTLDVVKFQSITMSCGDGVALSSAAKAFNVVLVPFTGITVDITYNNGTEDVTITKVTNSAIERSGLTNMPVIDITPETEQGTDPEPEDENNNTEDLNSSEGTWE